MDKMKPVTTEAIDAAEDTCLKPTPEQLAFMDWEFGVFLHFGIRSFYPGHVDWDDKPMPVEAFDPKELDCRRWCRAIRDAGARYAILVCKHHDGFANWPSKYSDYSVASAPWKDGKGDVVREFTDACREYGLKVGLYYSPAQWGGKTEFKEGKEYDDYFIAQITELLTDYGKIDYLWFDGCGSEGHTYDTERIIAEIRRLQPEILLFEQWDPDTRWVGNESGYADSPMSYEVTFGEEKTPRFLPYECDFRMRDTWFDCEPNEDKIKSVDELLGIYELSVGRGGNFLLNIGPDARGLLPEKVEKRLLEFGEALRARYGAPVGAFGEIAQDGDEFVIRSEQYAVVDRVVIEEDLSEGESVNAFEVYAELPDSPIPARIRMYMGANIGHKAICVFSPIRTKILTVKITGSKGAPKLKSIRPFFAR